MLDGFRNY